MKISRFGMICIGILIELIAMASCNFGGSFVEPAMPPKERRLTLPQKCAPFYQDGTDKWINCMGVGRK